MAGNGKESLDLEEKALQAATSSEETVSRPQRERRPPDRYSFQDPDGTISSKPKSIPHYRQEAKPPPSPEAADVKADDREDPDQSLEEEEQMASEEEVEVEDEVTHNYAKAESAGGVQHAPQHTLQPASVPSSAPHHQGEVRPGRSRDKSNKHEPLTRSTKALSSSYTYDSVSSQSSHRSQQVELTPLQAAMIGERRKLGELQETESDPGGTSSR